MNKKKIESNVVFGKSKEQSKWGCSYEHPSGMFRQMENNACCCSNFVLIWTHEDFSGKYFIF